ncbi:MAG: GNAT family N-acetyltransferase [Alphaproteobacteria bacterium]|nr:GNAT family N-acetyltransferase [Alphaproteobacteria bacterium]
MSGGAVLIRPAAAGDLETVRALFREYEGSLGISLDFQGFATELAGLPGAYAPPAGALLIAEAAGAAAGCVALRRLDAATAEMKRLYVREPARGSGLGRRLAEAAMAAARAAGYPNMRLDTLGHLEAAIALYGALGFVEIPPYGSALLAGMRFFERRL